MLEKDNQSAKQKSVELSNQFEYDIKIPDTEEEELLFEDDINNSDTEEEELLL
jgi:hypothetical protein